MKATVDPESVRAESEALLRRKGLPVNSRLPVLEPPNQLRPPSASAVAYRAFVLSHLIGLAYDVPCARLKASLEQWCLWRHASAREQCLLAAEPVPAQVRVNAQWLPEAVQVLAWGLGLASLSHWRYCSPDLASLFPPYTDPTPRVQAAVLRPFSEIYARADLVYRLHWATRHLPDRGKSFRLNWQVLLEHHRALNWLVGTDPDWDEITTDT